MAYFLRQKSKAFLTGSHRSLSNVTNDDVAANDQSSTRTLAQATATSGLRIDVPKAAENSGLLFSFAF
jgi:hypothetical protein